MGSNGSDAVMVSAVDEAECSETTVEIKIKTLDSQTYTLRVNKRVPVPELKDRIATVTGVLSDQQRLICRGKVLKDDQLLSAYHVEDGHTLHLVVRQPLPPSSESTIGSMGSESLHTHSATDPAAAAGRIRGNPLALGHRHSILLGSFNVTDQGEGGVPDLNRIVSAVLGSMGMGSVGSSNGDNRGLSTEPGPEGNEVPPGAIGISSTQSHPQDLLHGAFRLPNTASLGPPPVIPDSLTTLSQYLGHLRQEFSALGGGHNNSNLNAGMNINDNSTSGLSAGQVGLPTVASLAEVLQSTRQMLNEHVGGWLSQLTRQLEDLENVTTPSLRSGIQSSTMSTGVLLQNLGALLLELGRTTMTLRIGQTPPEAVVNAGPAVFISSSGPNPIMVQPLPFQPGAGFGAIPMGTVSAGSALSGFFPRNIDIRIRTGGSSNVSQGEHAGAQQISGQTGPARDSAPVNSVHQEGAGVSGAPPSTGDIPGIRVIPIRRTVVTAVPAAVTRPSSSSSGSSAGLFYPLLARVQHVASAQLNDPRGSGPSSENPHGIPDNDHQRIPDSATEQQNVQFSFGASVGDGYAEISNLFSSRAASAVTGMQPPAPTTADHHERVTVQMPSSRTQDTQPNSGTQNGERSDQLPRTNLQSEPSGGDTQDAAPMFGIDEGMFMSRLLHQVMPFISQNTAPEPSGVLPERVDGSGNITSQDSSTQSRTDAGTSRRQSDRAPTSPHAKRQKRE